MRFTLTCMSRYFKRYVERELTHSTLRRMWNPLNGWKEVVKKEWYYGEHKPWTTEFKQENRTFKVNRIPVEPLKEWNVFKGDRVQILVGDDKGKQGLVNGMVKERNWVYVEGLNCIYNMQQLRPDQPPSCIKNEKPLLVHTQVKLVDPSDCLPTEVEWRYLENGERVRVSVRTGRVIPLPSGAQEGDDLVNPSLYSASEKDTLEKELLEVTFQPKLCTFEDDINNEMGIVETRKRPKTYWH